jgi:hypothetical protein
LDAIDRVLGRLAALQTSQTHESRGVDPIRETTLPYGFARSVVVDGKDERFVINLEVMMVSQRPLYCIRAREVESLSVAKGDLEGAFAMFKKLTNEMRSDIPSLPVIDADMTAEYFFALADET